MATANSRETAATEPAVGPTRYRIPRWVAVIGWPVAVGAAHAAFPVAISRHGPRLGWRDGQPGWANLLGLGPLGLGAALLAWALVTHYTAAPAYGWVVGRRLAPEYLLTHGPYRVTRNPMYVGALATWSGWTILLGSPPVAGALLVLVAVMRLEVEFEERSLAQHYGEQWRAYAARTPRWLRLTLG
jgi:protein-S-isoprenylcysteine O-methyltransferase Ste14